ncbi:MAG: phenylalanine--tRNA ligase subunit alpha [Candidatus Pacebacteria bacterium]|nr:phenylalanine--tRNA ligase subunit alpha [Candidatus Paceibacterota bacterium]MCD8508051.1 phenylalanine--tRNA ligase subunit alpha [Candidatus Paceibacterota bacterium]MCD8528289.1 phenylalanine--tRNA ligase subunit alpha [Candidatus Paceibacterota bacterium]MCD8563978.1 phenylalanine--tRNA ligase subunit alpha [Candidatus Paceibacterota bacterium]
MNTPDTSPTPGRRHPLTEMIEFVTSVFVEMGFEVADGPHLEDEFHNFDALNIPPTHPARDMQDTFFVRGMEGHVMRTHTSNVQIRFMENHTPPFKIIAPGMVYRNEATDATHEVQFHQIEGLVVGKNISVAHLKATLETCIAKIYGPDVAFRLRPGYFPFVEPGFEVDLKFNDTWLEVLGAGMVHPHVLRNVGIDPTEYSGFAFGIGIDRMAMMKWGIDDIRLLYQGDMRLHNGLELL